MRKIHHRRSSCPVQEGSGQGRRGDPAEMTRSFLSLISPLIWCSGDPDLSLWLMVWNMAFICFYDFPYIGNVITDELIIFQKGGSTTNQVLLVTRN